MFGIKHKKIHNFSPIKKNYDNGKNITYKIKFIDSFRINAQIVRLALITY